MYVGQEGRDGDNLNIFILNLYIYF